MDLTPELLGTGFVGLVVILGAVGQYLRSRQAPPALPPAIASIGADLGNREQMERLIAEVKRIADVLDDKNAAGINERLDALAEHVERLLAERPARRR